MEVSTIGNNTNGRIPTLGFFMSNFGNYQEMVLGGYHQTVWSGTAQVAEEYDANVVCFVGGQLNSQVGFQKHWNVIYDLAGSANLDGLIMLAATMQNYVGAEAMAQFCARYAPLPIVNIALDLEGIPSITIDNSVGLHELMKHMIGDHHYRRIAFIRGPELNDEADVRLSAYIEALKDHDIPFEPDLVAPGDFGVSDGIEAVKLLLDQRRVGFDAIVASNDNMAMGAWQELTRRGFNVPTDIAVTGFDDMAGARTFATPLTTIRQPLVEQGQQAARMLLEYIEQGTPLESLVLDTELVIRESCGCVSPAASGPALSISAAPVDTSESVLARQRGVVLADIQKVICSHFPVLPQSIELLVDAFFDGLQGRSAAEFLPLFSRLLGTSTMNLSRTDIDQGVLAKWQEVLSILREKALPYKQPGATVDIDGLLFQGCVVIAEAAEHTHSNLRGHAAASIMMQFDLIRDINAAADTQQIIDTLAQDLPKLGIRTCALALYEGKPIPPPLSRLLMACHDGKRLELELEGRLFPSEQLIPRGVLPGRRLPFLIIHPLTAHDVHFGFILMEIVPGRQMIYNAYEEMLEQVGLALHRALLQQQIRQSNLEIQRHAAELAEANTQLEQFAYVASHDLQEPLRMVTSYLQLVEKRYRDRLDADANEFIGYAVDGAARMKRMINDLLAYSRVTTRSQPLELTSCEDLLAQTLSNLEVAIRDNNTLITHDLLPTVKADGTQLMTVFQNLIGNAIKFRADKQSHIHISAERRKNEWLFSVQDNGIGIAPEHTERVFAIFSRLHPQSRYPGSGIGLAICKKVIERHGGRIWFESQLGEGTTFFFTIPALA